MNNHNGTNFMTAQAPLSMMAPPGSAGNMGQLNNGNGDVNGSMNVGGPGGMGDGGGPGGVGPADLDQLQQAYNRTGDRGSQHHPIAEFLYQLTKMLTDDNSEIIEWVDGRIKVHYPERLEGEVLHKYFRHSKFASFQRQLNYFGFRKIAGKGKMSPCSYVNEGATSDIRSLLLIKRKTNGSAARKAAMAQRTMQLPPGGSLDLRANLSALAAGAAAAASGQPGVNRLGNQAFNAAALFSQAGNSAAAGLGQFNAAFQQKMQAAAGGNLFLSNENAMQFLMSGGGQQKTHSAEDFFQQHQQQQQQQQQVNLANMHALNGLNKTPSAPSIEQLHAQLAASLANRPQNGLNPQLHSSGSGNIGGLASHALNNSASAPSSGNPGSGPASAALNAALNSFQQQQNNSSGGVGGPASAALNAAGGGASASSLFDSAANLKSLVGDHQGQRGAGGQSQLGASAASQQLLNAGLPSSSALFPENFSTASFGNLLASSNRLSSLLSLNSFLSRDPSVADLVGVLPQGAQQFAASQAASQAAAAAGAHDNKFSVARFQ